MSIFTNGLRQYGFLPVQMSAMRNCIAAIVMLGIVGTVNPGRLKVRRRELLLFGISGCSLFATGSLYYTAMAATSASTAVALLYTAPALVMLVSVLFLHESITGGKLAAMLLALVGCALVSGVAGGVRFEVWGIIAGIFSGIASGSYNISVKIEMRKGCDALAATTYCFLFAAITGLVLSRPAEAAEIIRTQWESKMLWLIAGFGLITGAVPYLLYTLAMKRLPAGITASMGVIEPMTATLISVIAFGETLSAPAVAGMVIILTSAWGLSRCRIGTA